MMAGLNPEERSQLGLDGLSIKDLNYLNIGDTRQDELSDAQRFADWKSNLAVLGIIHTVLKYFHIAPSII